MRNTDPLALYNSKRDFSKTAEPTGTIGKNQGRKFVVQKHDATRLHYDLRLELDGVLKSWAITRGPSLDPADKRLAVRTEDHPLSYADFEGTIPKAAYGAGSMMLWDQGTWAPIKGKSASDINKGHLHFILEGTRMKGEWLLVKMRGKAKEKRENWLLRKIADNYAGGSDDLVSRELTSIATGRSMAEIKAGADSKRKRDNKVQTKVKVPKRTSPKTGPLPAFRKPQLATLVDALPTGNEWLHEIKYDGYRCLLAVAGDKARIYTRSGKDWTDKFTEIADYAVSLDLPPLLIDGEIVKLGKQGNPDFSALQNALKTGSGGFTLFAFDLLEENGTDISELGNIERKERLAAILSDRISRKPDAIIRYSDHLIGAGEKLYQQMCKLDQEGIICKRADAVYRNSRTTNWVKVKCTRRQEFIIIGWRVSDKKGRPFASILLGQYHDDVLVYKGRVGTGFSEEIMGELATKFASLSRKTPPTEVPKAEARDAHWITPKLVAEIAFAEFTNDGRVRHGSFLGLRSDKSAKDVRPEDIQVSAAPNDEVTDVKITSADRVIFPDARASKGDLADYYRKTASLMLPWLAHRPISLVRCPQGRAKKCFFQRHDAGSFGSHVHNVPIQEKDGGTEDYLYIKDRAGILACVQMGSIEFHGWGARIDPLEQPDRMVFDLDPDEGMDFDVVKKAALDIRKSLGDIGLVSFAMLSGGKGVHVVVPLAPKAEWPDVKDFARRFATALAQSQPDRFTATMSKAKRKDKIFIDWLRNQRGSTSILPYSVRARQCAPVAAPISWEELKNFDKGGHFTINDSAQLVERANSISLRDWGLFDQILPEL